MSIRPRSLAILRVLLGCSLGVGVWWAARYVLHNVSPPSPVAVCTGNPMPTEVPKSLNERLAWAVEERDVKSVQTLLKQGADPNGMAVARSITLLSEAACKGDTETAKLLLRFGADVNPKGSVSPLAWATNGGAQALPMMRLLLHAGADVNARFDGETTVLDIARLNGGDAVVALLKKAGARE